MNRPLRVEHILRHRDIYRQLKREEPNHFGGLPPGIGWLKVRYLKPKTIRMLGSATMGDIPTLALHPRAFEWSQPILLKGLVRHELIHFVLGPDFGHGQMFESVENAWPEIEDYRHQRAKFVRALEEAARDGGYLHRYECPNCLKVILKTRPLKPESACDECCRKLNKGVWSESYTLIKVGIEEHTTDEGDAYDD